jgi:ABC-2 type transport system permease protein
MSSRAPRSALLELVAARTKEFLREPEALFWVFAFPIVLALALGFAFRDRPPDRIPVGIVEGPGAEDLAASLAKSPALLPRVYAAAAGRDALRTGAISLLVEAGSPLVYRFDPTRPDSRTARLELDDAVQRAAGRVDGVPVRDVAVSEKGARYIDWLVPGLLGMNIMGTGVWGVAFSIVTARGKKLLKRFLATPMRKSDYLWAQVLARFSFLAVEVVVLLVFSRAVFGVSVKGSWALLATVCVTGSLAFTAIGLLAASRVSTIEGVSGLVNLILVPMWIFSGVFFSYTRFPDTALPFIRALPLTALNDALRAVILEGAALPALAAPLAVLLAWGAASFALALKLFRWR